MTELFNLTFVEWKVTYNERYMNINKILEPMSYSSYWLNDSLKLYLCIIKTSNEYIFLLKIDIAAIVTDRTKCYIKSKKICQHRTSAMFRTWY